MIYEYNKKVIFKFEPDMAEWKGKKRVYWYLGALFSGASYLTFCYINPWVTILPGTLLLASMITLRMSSSFDRKTINKIEIVDNYHIKVYPLGLNGADILCDIQETELIGVQILPQTPEQEAANEPKSYLMTTSFVETIKGRQYNGMNLIIDPKLTTLENVDLLKCIVYGQVQHIPKFRYTGSHHEASGIDDILAQAAKQGTKTNIDFEMGDEDFAFFRKKWEGNEDDDSEFSKKK